MHFSGKLDFSGSARLLLQGEGLMAGAATALAERTVAGLEVNVARLDMALERNPVLVTALNPLIGYDRAAAIAKKAYAERRPVLDVAAELTGLDREELARLLDPGLLADGGPGRAGTR